MPAPATVTRDGDKSLIVARDFDAPRALVWRAFTDASIMPRWLLGPPGWEMHVCEMDLSPGGAFRWRWRNAAEGQEFGFFGTIDEAVAEERLVETQSFDPGSLGGDMGPPCLNTLTFADAGTGTRVITRIDYDSAATLEANLKTGMTDGMEMSYAQLDALIGAGAL